MVMSANIVDSGAVEGDIKNEFNVFKYVGSAMISDLRASI
jgi:hypothetical protein